MISIKKLTRILFKNPTPLFLFCKKKFTFDNVQQSPYFKPIKGVQQFFNNLGVDFRVTANTLRIRQCYFCNKPHNNDLTNMYVLNVNKQNGTFFCHRCQTKGSWNQLRSRYLNLEADVEPLAGEQPYQNDPISDVQYFYYIENLHDPARFPQVKKFVTGRGFKEETIRKYRVGAGIEKFTTQDGDYVDVPVVVFPMYQLNSSEGKLIKVKIRGASSDTKKYSRQFPTGSQSGFFGLNTIKPEDRVVVITQGEFDAMAVNQQTGYPAISLPQGAASLPDHLVPHLNQFEKIVLWMDNDEAGQIGSSKMAHKLGQSRVTIVKHQFKELKDANDFLRNKPEVMKELIQNSKTEAQKNIVQFDQFQNSIKRRIFNFEQYQGVEVFLQFFNRTVKGIRTKELSIVSGPTGCGKTTFLSQLSLDVCQKNLPVLWGSFEIRNQVLATNMLIQYANTNLYKNQQKYEYFSEQFRKLPLYFLAFHGSHSIDRVIQSIKYAIEKHNISLVVLDTLQFLLSGQGEGFQKFDIQDRLMSSLRTIATDYNVHIVIVIHPKKTEDGLDIQIHSIYGTSKAAQEADNIWFIQNRPNFRVFEVKKNRFDGEVGKIALGYDRETKNFFQLKRKEVERLINNEATVKDILNERKNAEGNSDEDSFSLEAESASTLIPEKAPNSWNKNGNWKKKPQE